MLSRVSVILWAVLSLCMITTGPFGTYSAFGFFQRMLFWVPVLAGAMLIGTGLHFAVRQALPSLKPRRSAALVAVLSCAISGPVLYALVGLIAPLGSSNHPSFRDVLLLVASLSLGQAALQFSNATRESEAVIPLVAGAQQPVIRLLQRLRPERRGELLAISVRDHYVDVHTTLGPTSLLMRLADAIAESHPADGAQVHRSHWVAWSAVQGVEREAGKIFLRLVDGARVPVSKNHREKLAQRGLLAGRDGTEAERADACLAVAKPEGDAR